MNPSPPVSLEDTKHFLKWAIGFYDAIPDENWCCSVYENYAGLNEQHCALGHLGVRKTEDIHAGYLGLPTGNDIAARLCNLTNECIAAVNDGRLEEYQQPTPRLRVVAYLTDLLNKHIGK